MHRMLHNIRRLALSNIFSTLSALSQLAELRCNIPRHQIRRALDELQVTEFFKLKGSGADHSRSG